MAVPTYNDVKDEERGWNRSDILTLYLLGRNYVDIATQLKCSPDTVVKVIREYKQYNATDSD